MTDKEIEKALELCASENLPCQECAYWKISTQGYNCRNELIRDVQGYIKRLKAENADLRAGVIPYDFCEYCPEEARLNRQAAEWVKEEKDKIRKDTAKEILQELLTGCVNRRNNIKKHPYDNQFETEGSYVEIELEITAIKEYAKRLGVEVDDD